MAASVVNDYLLDELRYLREKSDKQVESIIELRKDISDVEKKCARIESQLTKMLYIVGGGIMAGAGSGPLFQMMMNQ